MNGSSAPDRRSEILALLSRLPEPVRAASGSVLGSGLSALKPGPVYIMGLNPGGDPTATDHSQQTAAISVKKAANVWSAYTHDLWDGGRKEGDRPHQRRVTKLIREGAEREPSEVFSANAIFVRTAGAHGIPNPWAFWREHFWPIHQYFLAIVQPKIIVTLGNGSPLSSFTLLSDPASLFEPELVRNFREGKVASEILDLGVAGKLSPIVIGAPHPSRFPMPERLYGAWR